jgi:hypothetical protein
MSCDGRDDRRAVGGEKTLFVESISVAASICAS